MTIYSEHRLTRREAKRRWQRVIMSTTFRLSLVAWVVVFGFLYIVETTAVSTKGYKLTDLERTIAELENENRNLSVEVARHQSMHSLQERLHETNLVTADKIQYVGSSGGIVVVNR